MKSVFCSVKYQSKRGKMRKNNRLSKQKLVLEGKLEDGLSCNSKLFSKFRRIAAIDVQMLNNLSRRNLIKWVNYATVCVECLRINLFLFHIWLWQQLLFQSQRLNITYRQISRIIWFQGLNRRFSLDPNVDLQTYWNMR